MRKRKASIFVFLMAFAIAISLLPKNLYAKEASAVKQTDVYLVLDNSKSMKKTDPDFLLANAANQFFNSTPLNSRVGVITYSGKVENTSDLKKKNTAGDVLESFNYDQNGKNTNIGEALTKARDALIKNDNGNAKAIVLITDGADNQSEQYNIVNDGRVIPVYCVYINDGTNKESKKSVKYLTALAKDSGTEKYIEITSDDQIEQEMDEICRNIYGTTIDDEDRENVKVEANGSVDVIRTIGENIYTASGTISYTDEVALKITNPSGKIIYDALDDSLNKNSDILSVEVGNNITSLTLLWPDAGDYTFTVASKEAQEVSLAFVTIDSGAKLELSDSKISKGKTITATCTPSDDKLSFTNASLRIHDNNGIAVGSDIVMEDNGNGTFVYDIPYDKFTGNGDYFIVAVAETADGQTVASGKCNILVEAKKGFPIFIIPIIILLIIVIVVAVLKIVKGGKNASVTSSVISVSPVSPISVRIFGSNGQGLLVYQNIQAIDIPGGKETELFDVLADRVQDASLIPEEVKTVTLACQAYANRTNEQTLVVRLYRSDDPNSLKETKNLTRGNGRDLRIRLDSGDEVQFEWIGGARNRR